MALPDISVLIGLTGQTKFIGQMNAVDKAVKSSSVGIGTALTAAFAAVTAAMALSVKAASDFESSFSGVIKTIDGLDDGMGGLTEAGKELAQGFRDLALEIPISVNELNKIGELGGQLAVPKDDILSFTETIAKLGVTTDLATEDAATSLAQFINVTQKVAPAGASMSEQIERIGATIVDLGNNSATSESKIVNMAQRIAGAGSTIGLTQDQILSLSAAISSVGVEAELGGTALSTVFIKMGSAVKTGGKDLAKFAKVTGKTMDEFAEIFEKDSAEAIEMFIKSLDGVTERGGNTFDVIKDIFGENKRLTSTLLLAANASDKLGQSFRRGNTAYRENIALTNEANKKFATFESQLKLLKNVVTEAAIEIGNKILPKLTELAKSLLDNKDKVIETTVAIGEFILKIGEYAAKPFELFNIIKGMKDVKDQSDALAISMELQTERYIKSTKDALNILAKAPADAMVLLNGAVLTAEEALRRVTKAEDIAVKETQRLGRAIGVDVKLSFDKAKIAAAQLEKGMTEVSESSEEMNYVAEDLKPSIEGVKASFKEATPPVSSFSKEAEALGIKGEKLSVSLKGFQMEMVKVGKGSTWVAEKVREYYEAMDKAFTIAETLWDSFGDGNQIVGDFIGALGDLATGGGPLSLALVGIKALGEAADGMSQEFIDLRDSLIEFAETGRASLQVIEMAISEGGISAAIDLLKEDIGNLQGVLYALGIETDESIRRQIESWMFLLGTLEEGTAEFEEVKGILEDLYGKLGEDAPWVLWENHMQDATEETEDYTEAVKTLGETLEELGIETEESVRAQIEALEDAISKVGEGSYEYDQMAEKLRSLYAKLGETSPWKTQEDAIKEAEAAAELYAKQMEELKKSLEIEKTSAESAIERLNNELEELYSQRDRVREIKTQIQDIKNIISELRQGPVDFNALENAFQELGISIGQFRASFGEDIDNMISDYDQMWSDFSEASSAIEQITSFNIDLDTTQADEAINALIFRWKAYLETLDPNSDAYKEGMAGLEDLIKQFEEIGGVIDEEQAIEFNISRAGDQLEELEGLLDTLPTEQEINFKIAEALEQLNIVLNRLAEIVAQLNELDGSSIQIGIEYKYEGEGPRPEDDLIGFGSINSTPTGLTAPDFDTTSSTPVVTPSQQQQPRIVIATADPFARATFTDAVVTPRTREVNRNSIIASTYK